MQIFWHISFKVAGSKFDFNFKISLLSDPQIVTDNGLGRGYTCRFENVQTIPQ